MNKEFSLNKLTKEEQELLNNVKQKLDLESYNQVLKAINYSKQFYSNNKRKSGELYILHPISVANIALTELGLAKTAVISAILHDLYDYKEFNEEEVEANFGTKVLEIIRGLHKISGLYSHNITLQNQNYINLILNIITDIRIVLLKLADRLQNMRNISNFSERKQMSLAEEIGALYAPIAHRLGLYNVKTEMEEFWLKVTRPGVYQNIKKQLEKTSTEHSKYIEDFIKPIKAELNSHKIEYTIKGRVKSVYSIWKKIEKQGVTFNEVYDLFAIRIILKNIKPQQEKASCWNVYSIVSNIYKPNPTRLRDWITTPKSSGYESLHTTVEGKANKWVEIQIRTSRMDEEAEKGQAAHWKYKETKAESKHDKWLAQIRDLLESPDKSNEDLFDTSNTINFSSHVFVFTPAGDIKKLPKGATIIDFAYSIHSKIGNTCTGGKINGKIVPIRYQLSNGETVEVLTSNKQKPNESWLNIAQSTRVKNRIKRALKELKFKDAEIGKEELQRKLKQLNLNESEDYIVKLLRHFKLNSAVDLYSKFAQEEIEFSTIKDIILNTESTDDKKSDELKLQIKTKTKTNTSNDYLIIGDNINQINYTLGKCCNPVYGDKVFGFISITKGITIHRNNCPNAKELKRKFPYRIINVKWNDEVDGKDFSVSIRILGLDKKGILNHINYVFTDEMRIDISSLHIEAHQGIFEATIGISINDNTQLGFVIQNLLKSKFIFRAERIE